MITRVQKWGNSLGVRLGKKLLCDVEISVGDEVDITGISERASLVDDLRPEYLCVRRCAP